MATKTKKKAKAVAKQEKPLTNALTEARKKRKAFVK